MTTVKWKVEPPFGAVIILGAFLGLILTAVVMTLIGEDF